MATKMYVIGIEIDTDIDNFVEVEQALDNLGIDYELREEYTKFADTCDICGEEIEEGNSHYRTDENEHICEDCYLEWQSGKPSAEAYKKAEEFLIKKAEGRGYSSYEIIESSDFHPYGLILTGIKNGLTSTAVAVNVKDYENV